jgi:TetR/AcrR family transcriptional regulator, transcriptional repressor for nem operon
MSRRQTDKRDRLIQTAASLVYRQGFRQTTLAQIAEDAQVPVGTVYYFFKTKEELGNALVERYVDEYRERCRQWEQDPDPRGRIESFLQMMLDYAPRLAQSGCWIGTLCGELHKQGGALAQQATRIFDELLTWLGAQFRAMGQGDDSEELAIHLLSAVEGAALLTQSFHTTDYFVREARRLKEWLREENHPFEGGRPGSGRKRKEA